MLASALLVSLLAFPPYTPEDLLTLKPNDNATAALDENIVTGNATATVRERVATEGPGHILHDPPPTNLLPLAVSPSTSEALLTLKPNDTATAALDENITTINATATSIALFAPAVPSRRPSRCERENKTPEARIRAGCGNLFDHLGIPPPWAQVIVLFILFVVYTLCFSPRNPKTS